MSIFGFDPHSLSDDEITAKSADIMAKMSWAAQFNQSVVQQLQDVLIALDNERNERYFQSNIDKNKAKSSIIETDPQFKDTSDIIKTGDNKKSEKKHVFNLTKTPVNNKKD